jgi:putative ABC transport system permease protein
MNLAYRDIKHNLLRFVMTNFGLSLLLGIVIMMTGVYGGLIDDALRQARAADADIWVVQADTKGPFAESSRIPGDTRELVSRVYGVERAGSVTYQSVQAELNGAPHRLFLIGFEPGRPGGPRKLAAGRQIMRSHYEMIVDRRAGLTIGQEVPLGTRGHKFSVVGLMQNEVTSAGDPVAYITLRDAQQLQFELAPPAERLPLLAQTCRIEVRSKPQMLSDTRTQLPSAATPCFPSHTQAVSPGRSAELWRNQRAGEHSSMHWC